MGLIASVARRLRGTGIGRALGMVPAAEAARNELVREGIEVTATELARRAGIGDLDTVERLLFAGLPVDGRGADGLTALMLAARRGHAEVVAKLADSGATVDSRDPQGNTALIVSVLGADGATAAVLLGAGASVDAVNGGGQTALMLAAHQNRPETVSLLLAGGADPRRANHAGETPLTLAAARGHSGIVTSLLAAGVSPDTVQNGMTPPLAAAVGRSDVAVARALLEGGANPNARVRGEPLLVQAVAQGSSELARLLLEAPALNLGAVEAALECAVESGRRELALIVGEWLRHRCGAVPGDPDRQAGEAALAGALERLRIWLDLGVGVETRNGEGRTLIELAFAGGHAPIVAELLGRGATPDRPGQRGVSLLVDTVAMQRYDLLDLLLAAGADHSVADTTGATALHRAAALGQREAVRRLAVAGANVERRDNHGRTALETAYRNGFADVVSVLESMGAINRVSHV